MQVPPLRHRSGGSGRDDNARGLIGTAPVGMARVKSKRAQLFAPVRLRTEVCEGNQKRFERHDSSRARMQSKCEGNHTIVRRHEYKSGRWQG
jgi:hypothetical protein